MGTTRAKKILETAEAAQLASDFAQNMSKEEAKKFLLGLIGVSALTIANVRARKRLRQNSGYDDSMDYIGAQGYHDTGPMPWVRGDDGLTRHERERQQQQPYGYLYKKGIKSVKSKNTSRTSRSNSGRRGKRNR